MRKLVLSLTVALLAATPALACNPFAQFSQYQSSFGAVSYADPTPLAYFAPMQVQYRVQAPTFIAPSANAIFAAPFQTPVTIINNNNNNSGGPAGALRLGGNQFQRSFAPSAAGFVPVGVPFQQNNFIGRRAFRFSRGF